MENIMTIAMWIALGAACGYYAKKQGKNPYLWFFIGLFLGLLGLLLLFLLPVIQRARMAAHQKKLMKLKETAAPVVTAESISLEAFTNPASLKKLWYYLDSDSRQTGPMSFDAFERAWQEGKVLDTTFVWNEELPEWKAFKDLFALPSMEEIKNKKVST